jgi:hypothetical protein
VQEFLGEASPKAKPKHKLVVAAASAVARGAMHILRLLFCTLLLAAVAAGVSEPPPSAPAPPPEEEPAVAGEEEQQEEKGAVEQVAPKAEVTEARPAATQAARAPTTTTGADQSLGEVRLMTRYTQLHGDKTRSFRVEGSNNLAEFNYFLERGFGPARRVQMLGMYRGTDDRSIDPERNSIQKAYVRIFGPRDEYIFGDGLVNYSRLSFNQNIKGAQGTWLVGDNWKISGVSGIFIDRYGSLYKDLQGRPFMAWVAGTRLQYNVAKESHLGFNFSSSTDRLESRPAAPVGVPPLPTNNQVLSWDARYQLGNAGRIDAEYAYSFTNFDTRADSGCIAALGECDSRRPQPKLGYQGDYGARIEANYRKDRLSMRGSYVRYQPNFASLNARQIPDLQDMGLRLSYEVTNWLTVDGSARRSNNNLRNQLPFETRLLGPEAKLIFRDLWFYPRMTVEAGYRHRDVQASDGSIDRYVRIPFAEVTIPFGTSFFNFGWERRQAVDLRVAANTSNANRYFIGLRGMYDVHGWSVNPVVRFELERQSRRPGLSPPVTAPPTIPDFTLLYDSNRLNSVAVFVQAPRWFLAELAFRQSGATLGSPNCPSVAPPGPLVCSFPPAGFRRPSYRAALTYKIMNDENILFTFAFERNNSFYFTSPDYDERAFGGTLVYKFGRRR